MSVQLNSGVLIAETVGLLFEELRLDDTLGAEESLNLAHDIADYYEQGDEVAGSIGQRLASFLEQALLRVEARAAFGDRARSLGLSPDDGVLEAAQRILEQDRPIAHVVGLAGVPPEVASLALHDFELELRKLQEVSAQVRSTWAEVEGQIEPSALTVLNLQVDTGDLRDRGFFGKFRARSGYAKGRVIPHLARQLHDKSAEEMAEVLDRVGDYLSSRDRVRAQMAGLHPCVRWAVDGDSGQVSGIRVRSLRWLLQRSEAGTFGPGERNLLTNELHRRALSEDAARRWAKTLAPTPTGSNNVSFGGSIDDALNRVESWFAHPPQVDPGEFAEYVRLTMSALPDIAKALVVTHAAMSEPALWGRVKSIVALSQGPFGPGDPNRSTFRDILEECRREVIAAQQITGPLKPKHSSAAELLGELREIQGQILSTMRTPPAARGPLRVAIAGRTKAGKTSLRKVLTRDLTETGIGRGAHRTTRAAEAFAWDRITFVDTPGVSAKDDDYDAELALRVCGESDAVVWVFAESMHDEEAKILQSLLAVKPVLVVFNAKWAVHTTTRLSMFARNPDAVLGSATRHAERIRQLAVTAGVRMPMFIPTHVSAARRALIASGECHAAWEPSGIPFLESELIRVLSSHAQSLRSLRLGDQVRAPLALAAGHAPARAEALDDRQRTIQHRLSGEQRDMTDAVARAMSQARRTNQKNFAEVARDLPRWLATADGRGDTLEDEWRKFLSRLEIDATLEDFEKSFQRDADRYGVLLDREEGLEEQLQHQRLNGPRRAGSNPVDIVWRVGKKILDLVIRRAPRLARSAGAGPAGWLAVVVDVLVTAGSALTNEVRLSRIDRRSWEQGSERAARAELERVRQRVDEHIDQVQASLRSTVTGHFSEAHADLAAIAESVNAVRNVGSRASAGVAEVDRLTVVRLLELGNVTHGGVVTVDRVPNRHLRVVVRGKAERVALCLTELLGGVSSEEIIVTNVQPKEHQAVELTQ